METYSISGLPVVDNEDKLVGIITHRDVKAIEDKTKKVKDVMTKDVVCAKEDVEEEEALELMYANRVERLPIVDDENRLIGIITLRDILKRRKYPQAARDKKVDC